MKKFITLLWMVALISGLTLVAHANVMGPGLVVITVGIPMLFVIGLVVCTWTVLNSFRKK